jgi:hypothetical protein
MASLVESNGTVSLNPLTLAAFVSRVQHVPSSAISMDVRPLRGGLEAAAVARVGARWRQASGRLPVI